MQKKQIAEIRSRLLQVIPTDPEKVSGPADRIQKLATVRTDLTRLCEYSQAQKMRRLVILPPPAWTDQEARWAEYALARIADLQGRQGPEATLGLACFGVLRADFETALATLAQAAEPVEDAILPAARDDQPKPKAKKKEKPAKPAALESLNDLDDAELDDQTLAELDALKREIDELKK